MRLLARSGLRGRWFKSSLALLTVGGALIAGCEKKQQAMQMPPPDVTISQPVEREIVEWDEYTGRLEAVDATDVRARVSGMLESADFKEGSMVKKGQPLFGLDKRPFQAELAKADADILKAEALQRQMTDEYARVQRMRQTNSASEKELLDSRYNKESADAAVAASKAARTTAALNLEWADVTAPISGQISKKMVTVGNLITGGAQQGTMLTTIKSIDPIYCYVDADERAILKYRRLKSMNQRPSARDSRIPAYMALADETDFKHAGYIDFVDNSLNPATGTLQARARYDNATGEFTPGMFGRLIIPGSSRYKAVMVADQAIATDQGRRFVLVVGADNIAAYRTVTVGALQGGLRVVDGVKPNEWIVTNGLLRVRPGMKVNPKKAEMPITAGSFAAPPIPDDWPVAGTSDAAPGTQPSTTQPSAVPATQPSTRPAMSAALYGEVTR